MNAAAEPAIVRAPRKRGRPPVSDSDEIRARIVDAALRQFFLTGLEGASVMRIARDAGVSRQLIHQRFGSKEQLYEAVMAEREERFYALAELPVEGSSQPLRETLLHYAEATVNHLLQPWRVEFARLMFGGLYRHPELARVQLDAQQRARRRIAGWLDRGLADAGIDGVDTLAAADDFRALLLGIAAPVVLGLAAPLEAAERRDRITGLVNRFLRGLGLAAGENLSDGE